MKNIIFIGNSFLYYGGLVDPRTPRDDDKGYFSMLCRSNGDDFKVTNATYGGHHLCDFSECGCVSAKNHINGRSGDCDGVGTDLLAGLDLTCYDYVVMAESGDRFDDTAEHGSTVYNFNKVKDRFISAGCKGRFVYCVHTYPYTKKNQYYDFAEEQISELSKDGNLTVNWGKVCYSVMQKGRITDSGIVFNKNSFIVDQTKSDGYHPNLLTGYLSALAVYRCVTGKSAVGQAYSFCSQSRDFTEYIEKHYTYEGAVTNFADVFASENDMLELQKLIDMG